MRKIDIKLIIILVFFSSCEYMDEPTVDDAELLVNTWVVEKAFIDGQRDTITNYDPYELIINEDNTFDLTDRNGNFFNGAWVLQNNKRLILNPETADSIRYRIEELKEEELTILYEDQFFKDVPSVFRYELIPQ